MKKIYSHVGKLLDTPEAIICEVVRVIDARIKKLPAYANAIKLQSLWDIAYEDADGGELAALLLISDALNVGPLPWHITYAEAQEIAQAHDAAFVNSPQLDIAKSRRPIEAASLWYWIMPCEISTFLGGHYKYGMKPMHFVGYWNETYSRIKGKYETFVLDPVEASERFVAICE